jgi:hypothetical protein
VVADMGVTLGGREGARWWASARGGRGRAARRGPVPRVAGRPARQPLPSGPAPATPGGRRPSATGPRRRAAAGTSPPGRPTPRRRSRQPPGGPPPPRPARRQPSFGHLDAVAEQVAYVARLTSPETSRDAGSPGEGVRHVRVPSKTPSLARPSQAAVAPPPKPALRRAGGPRRHRPKGGGARGVTFADFDVYIDDEALTGITAAEAGDAAPGSPQAKSLTAARLLAKAEIAALAAAHTAAATPAGSRPGGGKSPAGSPWRGLPSRKRDAGEPAAAGGGEARASPPPPPPPPAATAAAGAAASGSGSPVGRRLAGLSPLSPGPAGDEFDHTAVVIDCDAGPVQPVPRRARPRGRRRLPAARHSGPSGEELAAAAATERVQESKLAQLRAQIKAWERDLRRGTPLAPAAARGLRAASPAGSDALPRGCCPAAGTAAPAQRAPGALAAAAGAPPPPPAPPTGPRPPGPPCGCLGLRRRRRAGDGAQAPPAPPPAGDVEAAGASRYMHGLFSYDIHHNAAYSGRVRPQVAGGRAPQALDGRLARAARQLPYLLLVPGGGHARAHRPAAERHWAAGRRPGRVARQAGGLAPGAGRQGGGGAAAVPRRVRRGRAAGARGPGADGSTRSLSLVDLSSSRSVLRPGAGNLMRCGRKKDTGGREA